MPFFTSTSNASHELIVIGLKTLLKNLGEKISTIQWVSPPQSFDINGSPYITLHSWIVVATNKVV